MTRNSFITLEITWTKEDRVCFSVEVGVIELWSHCGAAGSHRSALSEGQVHARSPLPLVNGRQCGQGPHALRIHLC